METVRFSPSGEYVAVSGNDGRLKIYESATNKFLQEFVSSSHLTEVCNCLEWAPNSRKAQQVRSYILYWTFLRNRGVMVINFWSFFRWAGRKRRNWWKWREILL